MVYAGKFNMYVTNALKHLRICQLQFAVHIYKETFLAFQYFPLDPKNWTEKSIVTSYGNTGCRVFKRRIQN